MGLNSPGVLLGTGTWGMTFQRVGSRCSKCEWLMSDNKSSNIVLPRFASIWYVMLSSPGDDFLTCDRTDKSSAFVKGVSEYVDGVPMA